MRDIAASLLERIKTDGVGKSSEINPFWRAEFAKLRQLLGDGASEVTSEQLAQALGYNGRRLLDDVAGNSETPLWAEMLSAIELGEFGEDPAKREHAKALAFVGQRCGLADYLNWVDRRRLVSNMNLVRYWWYARRLKWTIKKIKPRRCLEIGIGAGLFASLLVDEGLVSHYVLVDFPEMLLNAMLVLGEVYPQAQVRYGETPDFAEPGLVFWMLETSQIALVPGGSVDFALNFYSFMEMDERVRDFYFDEIYRTCRRGSIFYNVNKRQLRMTRRDGRSFENNPLFYPYRSTDHILEWEPDEFQQALRSDVLYTPNKSFAISRISVVR